jgi:hypothetical protein
MQHMVIYRAADGSAAYHLADDVDGAVQFVEHLRNVEQVLDARVYTMGEVPIEFKTYYKVEVGHDAVAPAEPPAVRAAPVPPTAPVLDEEPATVLVGAAPVTGGVGGDIVPPTPVSTSNNRFGLFGRT